MKIQHLSVIFIIIILPISMVISYYVNAQIRTITLQEYYDSKLVTATYDAVRSFQLNTLNNKYSSVSDSKRRDIEAAIKSFYNSLGTELGASGYATNDLQTFIPAILYSMYDGYYMYGKYYDESINDYRIGLKPYVFYSCRYSESGKYDFVVNYTLDNNIAIYGKIGDDFIARSGSLLNPNKVVIDKHDIHTYSYLTLTGIYVENTIYDKVTYDGVVIEPEILSEKLIYLDKDGKAQTGVFEYINYSDQKIYVERENNQVVTEPDKKYAYKDSADSTEIKYYDGIKCFFYKNNQKDYITDVERMAYVNAMVKTDEHGYTHLYSDSACKYFAESKDFSEFVIGKLKDITQENAVTSDGKKITDFDIITKNEKIFDVSLPENDPMLETSTFNQNRISVIQRTIRSNLAAEMANYGNTTGYEYRMPEFTVEDWDKIVNNVAVTVFMEGIPIGMKFYNNYCVIPNDKNKEAVTEDSIYILVENEDGQIEVHYPGCSDIISSSKIVGAYRNVDFERQSIVKNDVDAYYYYPHEDPKHYNCMVSAKGTYDIDDIITGTLHKFDGNVGGTVEDTTSLSAQLRKVYITALARERYDLYKTNGNLK